MKIFKLPDLGEGLPDAIIREWHVTPGDVVEKDQCLVSMETAKALVEVPAPYGGTIEKLFGAVDETIQTGNPLIGFIGEGAPDKKIDTGTVVGKIEQSAQVIHTVQTAATQKINIKATPAIRALARKLQVDLSKIRTTGERITEADVKAAAKKQPVQPIIDSSDWTSLSGVKRAMVMSMQQSHRDIVPVTLIDDADIHHWQPKEDITIRIIRAIIRACQAEPNLNAHFDGQQFKIKIHDTINLGLAVDMPHGLYVPVIKDVGNQTDNTLRETINRFKQQAKNKTLSQSDLHGATIVLSNFGAIAGRYANPIILPPTVAIVGIGRLTSQLVPDQNGQPATHRIMPISLTIDHRAITGGEAARFLRAMIEALS